MNAIRPTIAALACIALAACSQEVDQNAQKTGSTVGAKIDRAVDRTQEKLAQVGEKAEEKIVEAGKETQQTLEKAGDRISATTANMTTGAGTQASASVSPETRATLGDAAITASIKADFLKDPDLSVLKIDVDTHGGVVTLNGLADNEAAKTRAQQMAQSVKGVKEVRNYLTIKRV